MESEVDQWALGLQQKELVEAERQRMRQHLVVGLGLEGFGEQDAVDVEVGNQGSR